MNEILVNALYICHALVIWSGGIRETFHIWKYKSAKDVKLFWISCLVLGEFLALPRALTSGYWVWGMCHCVATVLLVILWIGVFIYGRKK